MHNHRSKKHYSAREREARRHKVEGERELVDRPFAEVPRGLRRPPRKRGTSVAVVQVRTPRHDCGQMVAALPKCFDHEDRPRFRRLCEVILQQRPGLLDPPYRQGVESLIWVTWHQQPETWTPQGKGLSAAFRSLTVHLLQSYPLSRHLWDLPLLATGPDVKARRRAMRFLSHLAFGTTPRLLPRSILPTPMTRRMLHLLATPPRPLSYETMVRRAQVLGHGGREQLVACLMTTRLAEFQANEAYWDTFIHWCCRQPDLAPDSIGPIVDFLHNRMAHGAALPLDGRTPTSLRRLVRAWHAELAALDDHRQEYFAPSGFAGGVWVTQRHEVGAPAAGTRWEVREILTGTDLVTEGRSMGHCVAIYGRDIGSGRTSIWTLTCDGHRRLTIEVKNEKREIRQARGKANRLPKPVEARCVQRWAEKNEFEIRCWGMLRVLGDGEG